MGPLFSFKKGKKLTMIENAKITSTKLGYEDHGIFTAMICVKTSSGCSCWIGGIALDAYDELTKSRKMDVRSAYAIGNILHTVGVDNWEDLPGNYIRVDSDGWGSRITKIGNIMEDIWFDFDELTLTKAKPES